MFDPLHNKRTGIVLFFILFFTLPCTAQENSNNDKLRSVVKALGQAEVTTPFRDAAATRILSGNVSIASVREKSIHVILSPLTVEWFIKSGYEYSIIEREDSKGIVSSGSMGNAMQWDTYPAYTQYDSIMRYFAASYPSLCRLDTIGTSIRGKLILVLKISDNCIEDETEPEVFYTSTIHGDETGGFILMLRLAEYLLKNYNTDNQVRKLVDNLEIWINPLANPDGTYSSGNVIESPVRFNANGYDLNRNFPDPVTPYTVKQKETLDMMRFLAEHRFVLSANFHSGQEVVNYPWDRWARNHPDFAWFRRISRAYADTVHIHAQQGYMTYLENGVTNGYKWYVIYGGRQDFVTYELQGREVTIELDDEFVTPVQNLAALWEYNRRSLTGYLENALYGVSGLVTDNLDGKPVPARIFIEGHDADNSHVYSDTITGEYVRLLEPGTWNLTFTAEGYRSRILTGIILSESEATTLDVEMERILNPADTSNPSKPLLYPNPCTTFIKAVLPENIRGNINVRIYTRTGLQLADFNTTSAFGIPAVIDVRNFAAGMYLVVFTSLDNGISGNGRFVVTRDNNR